MMNFLMKQMLRSQLGKLPEAQRAQIMEIFDKNPDLIMTLAKELQAEMAAGKSQQDAMMVLIEKHKDTLQTLFKK